MEPTRTLRRVVCVAAAALVMTAGAGCRAVRYADDAGRSTDDIGRNLERVVRAGDTACKAGDAIGGSKDKLCR